MDTIKGFAVGTLFAGVTLFLFGCLWYKALWF